MKKTSLMLFVAVVLVMFTSPVFAGAVFGPKQYKRTTGAPNVYTEAFSGVPGEAFLLITNGDEGGKSRVTSA